MGGGEVGEWNGVRGGYAYDKVGGRIQGGLQVFH